MAITKSYIDTALRHFKDCGVEPDSERNIVISLTSSPARMPKAVCALYSLLRQSLKPNKVILWLGEEQFPNREDDIPENILSLQSNGLEICWTNDIKSYQKLVPALREFPDAAIVTADDDIFYDRHWLRLLYEDYRRNNFAPMVYAHRGHRIRATRDGALANYNDWGLCRVRAEDGPSYFNFAATGAGALYPPHVLHPDVFNEELFLKLAPLAEDVFFWAMAVLNDTRTKVVSNNITDFAPINLVENEEGAGDHKNMLQERSNESLVNTFVHYPDLAIKLGAEFRATQRARGAAKDAIFYERMAKFKAGVLNSFIETHDIERVIEFGSGDDKQLSIFNLKNYLRVETSPVALRQVRQKFVDDVGKVFLHMDEYEGQTADLALSLDAIDTLIKEDAFDAYMRNLFASAEKYVVIFVSNKSGEEKEDYAKHRKILRWVERECEDFRLVQFIPNREPATDIGGTPGTSVASFYVFRNKMAFAPQTVFPKISILVPVFNTEKYLRQCMDSILGQTYQAIEVICVNDCSTDNSLTILNEYAQMDKRVIVLDKHVNEGLPQARKTAFTHATGQYILPVDSDDWVEPDMIERLYDCSAFGGYDMVCCAYFQEKADGAYHDAPQILPEGKLERMKYGIFGFGNAKVVWNKLVKKEIYEKVHFGTRNNGEDCYITCQNLYYADKIGYCPLSLYHWRHSENSMTRDASIAQARYEDRKANYEHIIAFCKEKFGNELSFFEPELSIRMADIEKQNTKKLQERAKNASIVIDQKLEQNGGFKVTRMIDISVPVTTCNFRCHYCYVTQKRLFSKDLPRFIHTPQQMAKAFSKKRLGGTCVLNLCADGETLLAPEMPEIVKALLMEGHVVMAVTNGSVGKAFDKFVKFPQELRNRLFIKFSFHYLELLRLNILDKFFANVQKMKDSGVSFTVEITPCDELIPHIAEIKRICLENLGALPHITVGRDIRDVNYPILTKLSREEYKAIWSQFDSVLFDFKLSVFNIKQTEFCYGGQATYSSHLDSGVLKQCYREKELMNLYDDVERPIVKKPVGCNCAAPHCWNAHVWMGLGTVPSKNKSIPFYVEMRNRICNDGSEWVVGDVKKAFSSRIEIDTSTLREQAKAVSAGILQKVEDLRNTILTQLSPLAKDRDYWLLEVPYYSNIGDILIWAGEDYFFSAIGNGKCLYRTSSDNFVSKPIDKDTVIFLQGGGNFGDLWEKPQSFRKRIVTSYPDNQIVIFPQSIFYEDEKNLQADMLIFNNHKNLTICARDQISFEFFKEHFTANILLVPDMAFCIPPESLLQYKKRNVFKNLFIKRADKELNSSYDYSDVQNSSHTTDWVGGNNHALKYLKNFLNTNDIKDEHFPEFIDFYACSTFKNYMVKEGVELLSQYENVHTTRLHCMILCCLLGKPVTVFDNSYGKIKNFYDTWLGGTKGISLKAVSGLHPQNTVQQELEDLEEFLQESPAQEIRKVASAIFERARANIEKISNTPDQHLTARFVVVLSRVKGYLSR